MSEINSLADAEALLSQAVEADQAAKQPAPPTPAPEPAAEAPSEPQVTPDQPVEAPDLFADADIDLMSLSPAEELRLRQMQAHFTRKTQELAEQRREAEQALQFTQKLQSDSDFALQVHQELTQALTQAGLTPAQAAQAAAEQMAQPQDDPFDMDGYFDTEEEPQYRVPPEVQKQLDDLMAWKESYAEEQARNQYAADLSRQEAAIRSANPSYTDTDIDAIYERAFAHGGDLAAAEQSFKAERNRIIADYLAVKASVPASQPASTGPGVTPPAEIHTLDQAHEAAMEHLAQLRAQGLV